jgi:hypothetical protein
MATFDGLYKSQVSALTQLDSLLTGGDLGGVFVVNQFPFHGKVQSFTHSNKPIGALVGSSNLSNIVPRQGLYRGNYEVDVFLDANADVQHVDSFVQELIVSSAVPLSISLPKIRIIPDQNPLLQGRFGVKIVNSDELERIKDDITSISYEIQLKDTPMSNMNVFFGKGRENKHGFVAPRPWYEIEIIPGRSITSLSSYPQLEEFVVYTDDHYRFILKTSGSNNKNLRSRDDLTTIGRWLKGRLEMDGALESGKVVDREVYNRYGRSTLTLTKINRYEVDEKTNKQLPVWFIDFGVRNWEAI